MPRLGDQIKPREMPISAKRGQLALPCRLPAGAIIPEAQLEAGQAVLRKALPEQG